MQYFASMFSGDANLGYINNDRYGRRKWTTSRDVLEQHRQQSSLPNRQPTTVVSSSISRTIDQ